MHSDTAHSQEYIDDTRLSWWTISQLSRNLRNLVSDSPLSVLDVGVGEGHWMSLLVDSIGLHGSLFGLDFEQHWVNKSSEYFRNKHPLINYKSLLGDAQSIPFPDGMFNIVTCQTVLMHIGDPQKALEEMSRVLKDGGSLIISEPSNQINRMATYFLMAAGLPHESDTIMHVWNAFHCARKFKSLGDQNISSSIPTLLKRLPGFSLETVFQSEVVDLTEPHLGMLDVLINELTKPDIRELCISGGATDQDIIDAISAYKAVEKTLISEEITVASPVPQFCFVLTKNHSA